MIVTAAAFPEPIASVVGAVFHVTLAVSGIVPSTKSLGVKFATASSLIA